MEPVEPLAHSELPDSGESGQPGKSTRSSGPGEVPEAIRRETARYCAVLAYDGTDYQGFQRLTSGELTIQGEVEAALTKVSGQTTTVIGAGRTDAGVHATGQVIAFDLAWKHEIDDLLRAVNALLPNDIAMQKLERAGPDFHPRYDATSRTYQYFVYE